MATVILLRHGRTTANASGVLAGRTPGVALDERGRAQADDVAQRLREVPLTAVHCSPQERCRETVEPTLAAQAEEGRTLTVQSADGLAECDYGSWQGRTIAELAKEPLWATVQRQPSIARFPGGESMRAMQQRAVETVRGVDEALTATHGANAVWLAVSHGDVIKSVLADALGLHLDLFQRLHVDPASITVIRYTDARPQVLQTNSHAGSLAWLAAPPPAAAAGTGGAEDGDAALGGGAGPDVPGGTAPTTPTTTRPTTTQPSAP